MYIFSIYSNWSSQSSHLSAASGIAGMCANRKRPRCIPHTWDLYILWVCMTRRKVLATKPERIDYALRDTWHGPKWSVISLLQFLIHSFVTHLPQSTRMPRHAPLSPTHTHINPLTHTHTWTLREFVDSARACRRGGAQTPWLAWCASMPAHNSKRPLCLNQNHNPFFFGWLCYQFY